MDLGLAGKVALVTGSSRGIGRAIATRLVEEGADVVFCARGAEALDEAVSVARGPGRAHGVVADVVTDDGVAAVSMPDASPSPSRTPAATVSRYADDASCVY